MNPITSSSASPIALSELLRVSPVIPVVTIHDADKAAPLARALLEGGVGVIELTLRTPAAMTALHRIVAEVPEIIAGAGTVLSLDQATSAVDAGARFLVSPGCTPNLLAQATELGAPLLPGVATVTEMLTAVDWGLSELKFFPAGPAGGAKYLKAIGAPVPQVTFCPTGGVSPKNAAEYLALDNVACVGGSWLTPEWAIDAGDWNAIRELASESVRLKTLVR